MEKVRFEIAGDLGVITLANPPLNLFSEELIGDLREAVTKAKKASPRALMVQVLRRRRCEDLQGKKRSRRSGAHYGLFIVTEKLWKAFHKFSYGK
jgi:hypothetical protein